VREGEEQEPGLVAEFEEMENRTNDLSDFQF
jgi:hypothetical protein